ncbi:hypothetical protein LWI28_000380 [Acer negundo]|uniref:Uncharacterized protein n=1 Tax=Acer negundo TaxID=4023 RepID=A0AAD5J979_ACENE|nr:hypothetical protein LWI28_000380 [Acer negundo]
MEANLDRMFMNITATGNYAWAPSTGVLPSKDCQILNDDHVIPLDPSGDVNNLIQIKSEDGEGLEKENNKWNLEEDDKQAIKKKKSLTFLNIADHTITGLPLLLLSNATSISYSSDLTFLSTVGHTTTRLRSNVIRDGGSEGQARSNTTTTRLRSNVIRDGGSEGQARRNALSIPLRKLIDMRSMFWWTGPKKG